MRLLSAVLAMTFALALVSVATPGTAAACDSVDWRGECNPYGE